MATIRCTICDTLTKSPHVDICIECFEEIYDVETEWAMEADLEDWDDDEFYKD